ncbi:MAG: Rpn family recombination-promoting nuclease/putative transposase [Planctomycetaceae bacterium]|jgi:predicted transposase/invertase (TIGR01784 family)|nr:Rpn family recombination-promoting nuclease/putative transposase [Planctomycetaceae bacterium]
MNESTKQAKLSKTQRLPIRATADTFIHFLFASRGHEMILLAFVNAILNNAKQPLVESTEVQNPFNPKTFLTDKRSIIDIKAVAKNDRQFVIEFQVGWYPAFGKRLLWNWGKAFCGNITEGEHYEKLIPVVVIVITNFLLFDALEKLHNVFWITAQDNPNFILSNDFQMHVIEVIAKKINQIANIDDPLKGWLLFLWFADKKTEKEMKFLLQDSDPMVNLAYDKYLQFCEDEELRQIEDARQQYLHDYATEIEYATRKGINIGREEGRAEGREEGRETQIEILLRILTKRFEVVPITVRKQLRTIKNLEHLAELTDISLDCKSIDEFKKALKK